MEGCGEGRKGLNCGYTGAGWVQSCRPAELQALVIRISKSSHAIAAMVALEMSAFTGTSGTASVLAQLDKQLICFLTNIAVLLTMAVPACTRRMTFPLQHA